MIISDELNLRKPGDSLSDMKDEIFDFYWNYRVKWQSGQLSVPWPCGKAEGSISG